MSDLLPPNATDAERALSIAVRPEIPVPLRTLWNPYACPANVLPWLAWALSVDEWSAEWPETTQRQTIAASISQHKIKGTVGAVKSALLRGLGRTVEINENTGVPYTFGIRVQLTDGESAGGAIGGELMGRARDIVARTKNARSELTEEQFFTESGTAKIYAGAAVVSGIEIEIKNAPPPGLLDGTEDATLCAFWCRRMFSTYEGSIGRVRRASDGQELDYFSSSQLAAFVDGTTFVFLRLYDQKGSGIYAASVGALPATGGINGDGHAYIASGALVSMKATVPASLYSGLTILAGGKIRAMVDTTLCKISDSLGNSMEMKVFNDGDYKMGIVSGSDSIEDTLTDIDDQQFFGGTFNADERHIYAPLNPTVNTGIPWSSPTYLNIVEFPLAGSGGMFGVSILRGDNIYLAGTLYDNYGSRLP